jgi:hypothetical protein
MFDPMGRAADPGVKRYPSLVAFLSLAALVAMLLFLVGRPLGTDDVWWHLALGERYAEQGPYLAEDPLLYTAEGPPAPAAWLFDLILHGAERALGFQGLRVLHVSLVLAILALAYSLFRRESGSQLVACLATSVLIGVAWYRFMQLRAGLLTILAVLALYRLLLEKEPPTWPRVLIAVAMIGVWANVHAAFPIGPLLLFAALLGMAIREGMVRWGAGRTSGDLAEAPSTAVFASRVAAGLALGLVASLANPQGVGQLLAIVTPSPSPELSRVADDWMPFRPFAFGDVRTRLGPLIWLITDALLVLVPALAIWNGVRFLRRPSLRSLRAADPVLFGLAAASLVAMVSAIRFQWLIVFPLLFVLRAAGGWLTERRITSQRTRWGIAAACALLVPAFVFHSGYSPSAFGVPTSASSYLTSPFAGGKYYSHAVWFLSDAELEGNLFNDYYMGGYVGFWLTPRIRAFVNGTLNFPAEVGADLGAIKEQRGALPGETFLEVLDRREVDLFVGIGLPIARDPLLARVYTTPFLTGAAGWTLVFRDLRSAVYLRNDPRNEENARRVAAYYARERVPYDPEVGFDALAVMLRAPAWAVAHGLMPSEFSRIAAATRSRDAKLRARALERLAGLYGLLGAHEEQVELDAKLLRMRPGTESALRRLIHGLLLVGRPEEALARAQRLLQIDPEDARSRAFHVVARRMRFPDEAGETKPASDAPQRAPDALIHRLPLYTRDEATKLIANVEPPPPRRK